MQRNDSWMTALAGKGFVAGSINDRTLEWLQDITSSEHKTISAGYEALFNAAAIPAGTHNDRMSQYLASYPGALSDKLMAWSNAGLPVPPA